tara:strand:+ start:632936 stop:633586 length:651 start_codon:yes stop_codon:yes gene_type:complete
MHMLELNKKASMNFLKLIIASACILVATSGKSEAGIIAFEPLAPLTNGSIYTGHSEMGFDITSIAGEWRVGGSFGNPIPSIYANPDGTTPTFEIDVVESNGATFSLNSVDLASNNGASDYAFTGYFGGSVVLTQTGSITPAPPFQFYTIANTVSPNQVLDRLVVGVSPVNAPSSFNMDNINLAAVGAPVPEPTTLCIFGCVTLAAVSGGARRRRKV